MPRKLDDILATLPAKRRERVQARALELASLKELRLAAGQTQQELAAVLQVGQDTVSRLEKRGDMLLSTLREYVEGLGGHLSVFANFPDRSPILLGNFASTPNRKRRNSSSVRGPSSKPKLKSNTVR